MKTRFKRRTVNVAEVRDYLDEYCEWDEVLVKDGDQVMPLALGVNPRWHGDWTSVESLQSALDELGGWEPLGIRSRGGRYRVIGLESSRVPTLIVARM